MDWIILVLSRYFWFWFNEWIKKNWALRAALLLVHHPQNHPPSSSDVLNLINSSSHKTCYEDKKKVHSFMFVCLPSSSIELVLLVLYMKLDIRQIGQKKIECANRVHPSITINSIDRKLKNIRSFSPYLSTLYPALLSFVTLVNVTGKKYTINWIAILSLHTQPYVTEW